MKNQISLLPLFALILVACAPQAPAAPAAAFHVTEDDALTGPPESFLLSEAELEGSFTQSFATIERTNEMFAESEAYIELRIA